MTLRMDLNFCSSCLYFLGTWIGVPLYLEDGFLKSRHCLWKRCPVLFWKGEQSIAKGNMTSINLVPSKAWRTERSQMAVRRL